MVNKIVAAIASLAFSFAAHADTRTSGPPYIPSNVKITGGTINGATVGATTAATGRFSSITATGLTSGSVPYVGTNGLITQDNSNFFWDSTNKALGIGTNSVTGALGILVNNNATNASNILLEQAGTGNAQIQILISGVVAWVMRVTHATGTNELCFANTNASSLTKSRVQCWKTNNHPYQSGATPSLATGAGDCATSPSLEANSNDMIGRITVGTGANGGKCTITFANAWSVKPVCSVANETTANLLRPVTSTTTLALTGVLVAGDTLTYRCSSFQ
ncbi:MAG TPA: hypothetical protein PLK61_04120 [Nitrosomonas sp.]|nr:hypothetical protein [Nitrosomonas sp.]